MLEKEIEKTICDYAKSKNMIAYKFNSPARAAVPDRLFIYQGVIWFIEFKAPGKKPTNPQYREIAKLGNAGATVFIVDDITQGKYIIDMVWLGVPLEKIHV